MARCNKPLLRVQPDRTAQPLDIRSAAIALLLQPVAPAACRCQVAAAASIYMQSYVSLSKPPSHQATKSLLTIPTTPDGGHLYNWSDASTSNAILVVISSSLPGVFTRHCWSGHPAPTAAGASTYVRVVSHFCKQACEVCVHCRHWATAAEGWALRQCS
jgi:hypothetical protein